MNKNLLYIAATATICLLIVAFSLTKNSRKNYPIPTETIVLDTEEDSEGQSKREEWIELMHRAAPGDNWRDLEYQNQRARSERRLKAGHNIANMRGSGMSDTIVAGVFSGMWQEKGSRNQAGSVFDTEFDPETDEIWLISAGGTLWKGQRDGSLWEVVNQDYRFNVGTLKFMTTETGRRLIASINNVPHYSDDDGLSWTASTGVNINDQDGRIKQTQIMGDTLQSIYLLSKPDYWGNWRIFKSEDKGESYTQLSAYNGTSNGNNNVTICKPYNSNELYFLERIGNSVRLSRLNQSDGSAEILSTSNEFLAPSRISFVGSVTETDTIFYSYSNGNQIYKTTDFGQTWTEQGTMPDTPWEVGIYLSPSNPDVLYAGGLNCFRTWDGGQSWDLVNEWYEYYENVSSKLHADMMDFNEFTTADGEVFALISNHGGLSISYDNLASVDNIGMDGLNVSQYYSVKSGEADANYIIAGSQDQGLQRGLDDGGEEAVNFDQVISGDYGHVTFTNNGNSFWTVYPYGWITYYDNAFSGGYTNDYDMGSNSSLVWLPPLKPTLIPGENSIYLAGGNLNGTGNNSHLIKLEKEPDGGISTSQFYYDFYSVSEGELSAIAVSPLNPDIIYTATYTGRFFYSNDGGSSFEQNVNFLSDGHYLYGQSIFASQIDSNTVYLAGSGYSGPAVYKSTNGGEFFSDFSEGLPPTLVFEITANATETLLFAATEDGPYVYIVAEEKWFDMSGMCAPSQTYWSAQYVEDLNLVRFGTYGRGAWDFVIEEEPTDMPSGTDFIAATDVFKVYPQPAQSYLTVELTKNIDILHLTDVSGRRVQSFNLTSQKMTLDVSPFARGIYFLNGEYEGKVFGEKVILK